MAISGLHLIKYYDQKGRCKTRAWKLWKEALPDGKYLMEVKISGAVPLWFTKIISGLNVYPVSFSKYGTEYKQYVLTNYTSLMYKGENICLNQSLHQHQRIQSALASQC